MLEQRSLVAPEAEPKALEVEFYHCKFSLEEKPGARVDDLYQVCGQAQKSIHWMRTPETKTDLLTHLLRRDWERREQHGASRFEQGDGDLLYTIKEIREMCPMSLRITIVQPGLSKADVSFDQLQLLAATENHLFERQTFRSKWWGARRRTAESTEDGSFGPGSVSKMSPRPRVITGH